MAATYMQMMDHVLRTARQRYGVLAAASILLLPALSHAQGSGVPFGRQGASVQADQDAWAEVVNNGTPTGKRIRGSYLGGSELYLRLTDLGRYLSADDRWDFKNKYELIAGDKRLKFTLDSPMVIVDNMPDQAVNLPRPVVLHGGALYAPASGVAQVLAAFTGQPCEYLPDRRWLNYGGSGLNLLGVEIVNRSSQGTEVRIKMTEPIPYEKTFVPDQGLLNLTFTGARANLAALREVKGQGLIRKVDVFEEKGDTLQLTFYLSRRYSGEPSFAMGAGSDIIFQLRNASAGEPIAVQPDASSARTYRIRTIVIDPGHGGKDPGSIGPTGLKEKDVALDVALRLKERLEKDIRFQGVNIVMTRDKDVFIPLPDRTRIANEAKGDLFVSIHANSFSDPSANGFMTFFLAEYKNTVARQVAAVENSAIKYEDRSSALEINDGDLLKGILGELISTKYLEESQVLADQVQQELQARISRQVRARQVDQAPFLVLNGAMMPSVLVECAFISNKTEEGLLKQTAFKNKLAESIHAALLSYRDRVESNR